MQQPTERGTNRSNTHERKEHEMNNELIERIRLFNCKAEKAEKDGYTVADGFVWDGWGNHTGPCARKICKVEDYR